MSTYVIGDVHGCFKQFIGLLKKINYNKIKDRIILTGDLVNRGPESLAMLNFCMKDSNITTVLGNHDLYLMYLLSIHQGKGKLKKVVEAKNSKKIFKWLKQNNINDKVEIFLIILNLIFVKNIVFNNNFNKNNLTKY